MPPVAIIGGGPCGLVLARLLEMKKIDYMIYERDQSPNVVSQAGILDLHPGSGQEAMKEAGLWDEFTKSASWEDDRMIIYDKHGKVHLQDGDGNGGDGGDDDSGRPEIDRAVLRKILLESIPQEKIRWRSLLNRVEISAEEEPVLHFTDGSTATGFALVVGTDGAWSKTRPLLHDHKPIYSGRSFIDAHIDTTSSIYSSLSSRLGAGTAQFLAGAESMVLQRQGNKSYRIYFSINIPIDEFARRFDLKDVDSTRRHLLEDFFADWPEEIKDYVREAGKFRHWPLYYLPTESMPWKPRPKITLAGDAAHLALPNGEGVNSGMLDALELASKLSTLGFDHVDQAISEYEHGMFQRGKEHIEMGLWLHQVMFDEAGPEAFVKAFSERFAEPA